MRPPNLYAVLVTFVVHGRGVITVTHWAGSNGIATIRWLLTSAVFCGVESFSDDSPDPKLAVTASYTDNTITITSSDTYNQLGNYVMRATVKAVSTH
jgi:hypothetical protein